MARERPRRQPVTAHERVAVQPARTTDRTPREPSWIARMFRRVIGPALGRVFGVMRAHTIEGVRYREQSREILDRALSSRGRGTKSYEVRFPNGRPMTINVTETRRFADLMPVPTLDAVARTRRFVRPGERVLILGSGTGAIPDRVAGWTGPHGGVVALEHDHESVRFARRRYTLKATSLERGGPELLAGELPAAFDVVIADQAYIFACEKSGLVWDEIWRVLAEGGRVIHIGGSPDHPASAPRVPSGMPVRGEQLPARPGALPVQVLMRVVDLAARGEPGR